MERIAKAHQFQANAHFQKYPRFCKSERLVEPADSKRLLELRRRSLASKS